MVEKYGSDQQQIATLGGGVISEDGATLLSSESFGESALLFGPQALREIKAGVANGDFAIAPADDTATITADNALPYWTFTDVNSAGAITAALVADAGAASGNVLRFTVASGTLTGKSATLSRFIPVASSASRSFSFYAEATFETGTASTQSTVRMSGEFYKNDQATTTGSPITSSTYTFASLAGVTGITAPDLYAVAPDLTTMTAPADAAFLKITITIATVATQSANRTVDLTEVRVAAGLPELLITDRDDPTNPPAIINAAAGELNVQSGAGNYLLLSPDSLLVGSDSVSILSGGPIALQTDTAVGITAPSGVTVSHNLTVEGAGRVEGALGVLGNVNIGVSDISTAGALVFKGGNGGSIRAFSATAGNDSIGVYNTNGSSFGFLVAENFYPGGQGTAFITHDGNFDFNDSVDITGGLTTTTTIAATGNITSSGTITAANNLSANGAGLFHDTPTGVTLASGSTVGRTALWTLNAGTQYNLQRWTSTSTAALKKNILQTTLAPEQVYNLALVDFDYDLEKFSELYPHINVEATGTQRGVIWEQVADVLPEAAVQGYGPGDPPTIDWEALYFGALVAIQDLNRRLEELESR